MRQVILVTVVLVLMSMNAGAQLKVNSLFSDHAIIQQGQPVRIWGKDTPGNEVFCTLAGKTASSFVSKTGEWFLELENGLVFQQDYVLEVESESGKLQFEGLVLGDVWVASGQSNMARSVNTTVVDTTGILEYLDTLSSDSFENLRMFSILPKQSQTEERFIDAPLNSWQKWIKMSSLDYIRYQSAVAYYTGRRLHKELDYPIGVIVSAVGGTEIELWGPEEAEDPSISYTIPASSHFNAMISPLIPLSISGVIWYQGEANSSSPDYYAEKTLSCFNAWQNRWSRKFPVFTTLLAGYQWNNFRKTRSEQLLAAQNNENFHVASAFDLGIEDDIHPYQKKELGERHASLILNEFYSIAHHPYLYPRIESSFFRNDSLLVKIINSKNLKVQNEPIITGLFQTYDQGGLKIQNEASFLSDSIIYLNTYGLTPDYFEYNHTGYAENHIRLDGLPMHPYSSQFDTGFDYDYTYNPTQHVISDSLGCYSSSVDVFPILLIDTVTTLNQVKYLNVTIADGCVLKTDQVRSHFSVYPNPSNGNIYFSDDVKKAIVYTQNGKVILEEDNVKTLRIKCIGQKLVLVKVILKTGETVIEKLHLE